LLLLFVAAQFPLLYEYTFVFGRGGGALCRVPCFCGEPIVPSSVVLGAAVALDSRRWD